MNKIKTAKIINMYNPKDFKNYMPRIKYEVPKDNFVRSKFMDESKILKQNKMIDILSRHDYNNVSDSLIKENYWSDSANFVAFNKENKKINSASLGLFNSKNDNSDITILKVDDFIKLYTKVTANQMDLHPDKQIAYRNKFKDLLTYIAKNRSRE